MPAEDRRPLIAHVVYRLDVGGLENGVVNLINRLPEESFRHAVISLTDITDFRERISRRDVRFVELHKPPGHAFRLYGRLRRLFREMRPAVVHTRNLAALEAQVPAWLAGVPVRIHGEHGRDMSDLSGNSRKYRMLRRLFSPWVQQYVTVSRDLEGYLVDHVHVSSRRVRHIYNGVDVERFQPKQHLSVDQGDGVVTLGWVGRMQPVKDPLILVELMRRLATRPVPGEPEVKLLMVGDGPMYGQVAQFLADHGLHDVVELAGNRDDIPELLRRMDLFLLPSLGEGISNTVLEAMATGLPVIASAVGGNLELVDDRRTGRLVPVADIAALEAVVRDYLQQPAQIREHGASARERAEARFSLQAMIEGYDQLYRSALGGAMGSGATPARSESPLGDARK